MSTFCSAFAYANELSERTFAAIAALIGAATFAFTSDIAARSGSSSPASSSSSSRVSFRYSWSAISAVLLLLLRLRRVVFTHARLLLDGDVGRRLALSHVAGDCDVYVACEGNAVALLADTPSDDLVESHVSYFAARAVSKTAASAVCPRRA